MQDHKASCTECHIIIKIIPHIPGIILLGKIDQLLGGGQTKERTKTEKDKSELLLFVYNIVTLI